MVSTAISRIDIVRDQNLFVTFNLRHFTPPPDWKFEVCASYYDTVFAYPFQRDELD